MVLSGYFSQVFLGASWLHAPRSPADLLSINYDVLPNIYAPKIVHGAKPLGVLPLLPSRSLATRLAACWAAILVMPGCSTTPVATPLTTVSQPRLASGQPVSLEQTYAYDGGPTGAVPLPSPSSPAVAVMDGGNGSMIGGTYSKRKTAGASPYPDGIMTTPLSLGQRSGTGRQGSR